MRHGEYFGNYMNTLNRVYKYHSKTLLSLGKEIGDWNKDRESKQNLIDELHKIEDDLVELGYIYQLVFDCSAKDTIEEIR